MQLPACECVIDGRISPGGANATLCVECITGTYSSSAGARTKCVVAAWRGYISSFGSTCACVCVCLPQLEFMTHGGHVCVRLWLHVCHYVCIYLNVYLYIELYVSVGVRQSVVHAQAKANRRKTLDALCMLVC